MGKRIEYEKGDLIGCLIFIKDVETRINSYGGRYRVATFKCRCGTLFDTSLNDVRSLNTKSCGCLNDEKRRQRMTIHGKSKSKLMSKWGDMIRRTTSPKSMAYKNYGARGITVCEEWRNSYISFYSWAMENGYKDGLTIDRIDNDGNYEPSNCRWVNRNIQSRNTRKIISTNTSGYRGVSFHKRYRKFQASITIANKQICIGFYDTAIAAAIAYDTYVMDNRLEHTKNNVS